MEYGHKALINLSFVDGKEKWHMCHNDSSKYVAARIDTSTKMKYFNQGIQLMRGTDFRKKFREQSTYEPLTPWVLLISLSTSIIANGRDIIRDRNRTSMVVSCELESIHENHHYWPDPGLSLDPTQIRYQTTHIDYRDGKATIRCNLPTGLDLKESPFMYTELFKKINAKFVTEMTQFNNMSNADHYTTKEGQDAIFETITTFLTQIGIRRATAQPLRDRLASWVTDGNDKDAYIVKGVAFDNKLHYDALMETYNDEAKVLRIQHDRPLLEQLMEEHRGDPSARLKKLDLFQVSATPYMDVAAIDFQLGLTDEEWDMFHTEYQTAQQTHAEEFVIKKWQDMVIQRWHIVQAQ